MGEEKNQSISGATRMGGEDSTRSREQPRMCGERGKLVDLVKNARNNPACAGRERHLRDFVKHAIAMDTFWHQRSQRVHDDVGHFIAGAYIVGNVVNTDEGNAVVLAYIEGGFGVWESCSHGKKCSRFITKRQLHVFQTTGKHPAASNRRGAWRT